jgi:putative transposase
MRRAYKYRVKVSDAVSKTLDICRELYNAGLQERRDAYKLQNLSLIKIKLSNCQQSKKVELLKGKPSQLRVPLDIRRVVSASF